MTRRAIETRQLTHAIQQRVNELRDRLEALSYEHDRLEVLVESEDAAPMAA